MSMKKNYLFSVILLSFMLWLYQSPVYAWNDDVTHRDLSEQAVYKSIIDTSRGDFLRQLSFTKDINEALLWPGQVRDDKTKKADCTVKDWLKYGAEKEDAERYFPLLQWTIRPYNHFHDPLSGLGLHDLGQSGKLDYKLYLHKTDDGERIENFVRAGYFASKLSPTHSAYGRTFYLDEACHESYAAKLVPRAVGYSAALLDYFFRGRLKTVNTFVQYGAGFTISGLQFDVKNATHLPGRQSIEPMQEGKLDLACRYLDPNTNEWRGSVATDVYTVNGSDDPINSGFVSVAADFSEPIAFGARQLPRARRSRLPGIATMPTRPPSIAASAM
jgi:hypothetical protein